MELDKSFAVSSLWISCTKDWAADSSFFLTNEANPDDPMNSYYAELTGIQCSLSNTYSSKGRNLNHKAASVYFKAACGGLNVNHGAVAHTLSENGKREKRSDQVRREFKRTLITYYSTVLPDFVILISKMNMPRIIVRSCWMYSETFRQVSLRRITDGFLRIFLLEFISGSYLQSSSKMQLWV